MAEINLCTSVVAIEKIRECIHLRDEGPDPVNWEGRLRFLSIMRHAGERSDVLWLRHGSGSK
jgi:hypothetical protein